MLFRRLRLRISWFAFDINFNVHIIISLDIELLCGEFFFGEFSKVQRGFPDFNLCTCQFYLSFFDWLQILWILNWFLLQLNNLKNRLKNKDLKIVIIFKTYRFFLKLICFLIVLQNSPHLEFFVDFRYLSIHFNLRRPGVNRFFASYPVNFESFSQIFVVWNIQQLDIELDLVFLLLVLCLTRSYSHIGIWIVRVIWKNIWNHINIILSIRWRCSVLIFNFGYRRLCVYAI